MLELRLPTLEQLRKVYNTDMKESFPAAELKPLAAIERMWQEGWYKPYCLFDDDALVGIAFLWLGHPGWALLDYLCVTAGWRNDGFGSEILRLLPEAEPDAVIFGEAEAVTSSDPEEASLQARRLEFYRRNGLRYAGYDCALFGVHFRTLILDKGDNAPEDILAAHQRIYRGGLPSAAYERFIQIPLREGEAVRPAADWIEE